MWGFPKIGVPFFGGSFLGILYAKWGIKRGTPSLGNLLAVRLPGAVRFWISPLNPNETLNPKPVSP